MAFTLGNLKSHVQLMSGSDNLADKVTIWANRVLQEVAIHAYWKRNMGVTFAAHGSLTNATGTGITAQAFTINPSGLDAAHHELINVAAAQHVVQGTSTTVVSVDSYKSVLYRKELSDFYGGIQGSSAAGQTGSVSNYYAMVSGDVNTNTPGTASQYVVGYPFPSATTTTNSTSGGAMMLTYLGAPALLVNDSDNNWLTNYYSQVLIHGVMRYVRLYLGDIRGYMLEKAAFANGLRDMLLHEETVTAQHAVRRAVDSQILGRNP